MVRPWNEWLIVWGYDINGRRPSWTRTSATQIVRDWSARPTSTSRSRHLAVGATTRVGHPPAEGRVFCAGDASTAIRRATGSGSNTSIQDAYNLAWKLAPCSRAGRRRRCWTPTPPNARRSAADRHAREPDQPGVRADLRGARRARRPTPSRCAAASTSARRHRRGRRASAAALLAAMELKNYEFNAHGVELGQHYRSGAVVPDGTPDGLRPRSRALLPPDDVARARLPHVWVEHQGEKIATHDVAAKGERVSTHDLAGKGRSPCSPASAATPGPRPPPA